MIDVIITMDNLDQRFLDAGFKMPQYMIRVRGKTLLGWTLVTLNNFKENINQYIFVVRKQEDINLESFIDKQCRKMEIESYKIVYNEEPYKGQTDSVLLAKEYLNADNGLIVSSLCPYIEEGALNSELLSGDGFIPCSNSDKEEGLFVDIDENGRVKKIANKKTPNFPLGIYYFKSFQLFETLYKDTLGEQKKGGRDVIELYNKLILNKGDVSTIVVDKERIHLLESPEDVEIYRKEEPILIRLTKQALGFFGFSGIGWILDFTTYTILSFWIENLMLVNIISSAVGVTFVFIFSTHKVFIKNNSKVPIWGKYLIYLAYQVGLVYVMSLLLSAINDFIVQTFTWELIQKGSAIISKILVTPITMVVNFIIMKILVEKL